jgi:pimeloyl-ACP methyl ester carboxylesterase
VPRASLSDDIELEYEVLGSGRPLLLIGGLGAQLISWDDAFCEVLVSRGYSVIRFDNRDSGLSTILDYSGVPDLLGLLLGGSSAPYMLDDLAQDALGLLDHLKIERADVLGLSLGGMIAQILALEHPERVTSVVAALSGPPGRPSTLPGPPVVEALLRPPASEFDERVGDAVELRRALAGEGTGFDAGDAFRRARAQIARADHPAGTMRQAAAVLATPNRLADLERIAVPTMVVHGELDPLVSFASAQAAAAAIPGATFVGVPGLGHDLPAWIALDLIERVHDFHMELAISG